MKKGFIDKEGDRVVWAWRKFEYEMIMVTKEVENNCSINPGSELPFYFLFLTPDKNT